MKRIVLFVLLFTFFRIPPSVGMIVVKEIELDNVINFPNIIEDPRDVRYRVYIDGSYLFTSEPVDSSNTKEISPNRFIVTVKYDGPVTCNPFGGTTAITTQVEMDTDGDGVYDVQGDMNPAFHQTIPCLNSPLRLKVQ